MAKQTIPVMRPLLPSLRMLERYLNKVDDNRWYSNYGPLEVELTGRLTEELAGNHVVLASSGTSAIQAAILATAGRATAQKDLAVVADFTFMATGYSAEAAGYSLALHEVDPDTWQLDPTVLLNAPYLDRVGVVVPVGAMGRPVCQQAWQEFQRITGIPVVIDNAAGFAAIHQDPARYIGEIPMAVSFHATKPLPMAEGGAVICSDQEMVADVQACLNFGFRHGRESVLAATNGKLSEYHAAIGLVSLDIWPETLTNYRTVADLYRASLKVVDTPGRLFVGGDVAPCYALLELAGNDDVERVSNQLSLHGIDTRLWYGNGLSAQKYFNLSASALNYKANPLLLGLPMSQDLNEANIRRVAEALEDGR